MMRLQRQ